MLPRDRVYLTLARWSFPPGMHKDCCSYRKCIQSTGCSSFSFSDPTGTTQKHMVLVSTAFQHLNTVWSVLANWWRLVTNIVMICWEALDDFLNTVLSCVDHKVAIDGYRHTLSILEYTRVCWPFKLQAEKYLHFQHFNFSTPPGSRFCSISLRPAARYKPFSLCAGARPYLTLEK